VPPQFDPDSGTPAGNLLKQRLDEFMTRRPGLSLDVRVKAATGTASLLDTLLAAYKAAPQALPDLIALPRPDLETAALQGVLHPLDGLTTLMDDPDWYAYARQLARIQNTTYGLPFAGDAMLLVYRPSIIGQLPPKWGSVRDQHGLLAFPAADPQALFSLCLYLSAGGTIANEQGHVSLDPVTLTQVLDFYQQSEHAGMIPMSVTSYQTDQQAWQAYHNQNASAVVTWSSRYLSEAPADSQAIPLPGLVQSPYTLATSWSWALAGSNLENQALAVQLAEFLVDDDFLSNWTAAASYLPTRPNALANWQDKNYQALVNQVIQSAQPIPSDASVTPLGAALQQAAVSVLKDQKAPGDVAQSAADSLQ
jgi:multiple sugar transport system substrate-binding protein